MTAMAAIPRHPVPAPRSRTAPVTGPGGHALDGIASYYWQDQMTASGERFDRAALTAAHKTLPMGSRVRVTNVVNGRSVIVRINDRGPFKPGRVIDLSEAAARVIDMERFGLVPVKVDVLGGRG
jgi:rare lipoprotein A